jgi:hypothetical protein
MQNTLGVTEYENRKEYFKDYRLKHSEQHKEACRNWNKTHPERDCSKSPEAIKAHSLARCIPLAEFCETCPPDDVRKATQKHHPSYEFPRIFVSCCASCHMYIEKGVD